MSTLFLVSWQLWYYITLSLTLSSRNKETSAIQVRPSTVQWTMCDIVYIRFQQWMPSKEERRRSSYSPQWERTTLDSLTVTGGPMWPSPELKGRLCTPQYADTRSLGRTCRRVTTTFTTGSSTGDGCGVTMCRHKTGLVGPWPSFLLTLLQAPCYPGSGENAVSQWDVGACPTALPVSTKWDSVCRKVYTAVQGAAQTLTLISNTMTSYLYHCTLSWHNKEATNW